MGRARVQFAFSPAARAIVDDDLLLQALDKLRRDNARL